MTNSTLNKYHKFHLVNPSPWPLAVAAAAFTAVVGLVMTMHLFGGGLESLVWGLVNLAVVAAFWWRDVVREATFGGHHTRPVQEGLRLGFVLFVLSEVMVFFSFFWAFFYVSVNPALELGGVWPPAGITPVGAGGLALHNTGVLLLSGCTLTWSHYALMAGDKKEALLALLVTSALGVWFLSRQAKEFVECTYGISDSVYGSVFFMLTGLHGLHVLVGTVFLGVCLARLRAGHFTVTRHLGFEMAIWYWHFVDVVWLFLYLFVYVWGPMEVVTPTVEAGLGWWDISNIGKFRGSIPGVPPG